MSEYPDVKSEIQDGVTDMEGNQINRIEDYVGIRTDTDPTTITYKLVNPLSVGPGHKHPISDVDGGSDGAMAYKDPADHIWKAWLPDTIGLVTKAGEQTISAKKTFTVLPESASDPTTDVQLARKKFITDLLANYALPKYGSMYIYANSTPEPLAGQNKLQAVRNFQTGLVSGFVFEAGGTGAITAFASGGEGLTLVTSNGHGMTVGSSVYVTIVGTTNYNGVRLAYIDNANQFTIIVEYVAEAGAGNWYRGSNLKASAGSAGVYKIDVQTTIVNSSVAAEYARGTLAVYKGIYQQNHLFAKAHIGQDGEGDTGWVVNLGITGLLTVADNDVIWLGVTNIDNALLFTFQEANFNMVRVGN